MWTDTHSLEDTFIMDALPGGRVCVGTLQAEPLLLHCSIKSPTGSQTQPCRLAPSPSAAGASSRPGLRPCTAPWSHRCVTCVCVFVWVWYVRWYGAVEFTGSLGLTNWPVSETGREDYTQDCGCCGYEVVLSASFSIVSTGCQFSLV